MTHFCFQIYFTIFLFFIFIVCVLLHELQLARHQDLLHVQPWTQQMFLLVDSWFTYVIYIMYVNQECV
jgi:hypothetical protein